MTSFRDRRCFLTGAASGIGRATALAAAREGAVLFLTDLDGARLEDTVREVRAAGGRVAAHRALDVSDHEAVRAFAESIHEDFGSMDIVMNIAGISVWGAVDTLEHRHWRQVIEVNLMGPIHVIESFVPEMIHAGRGGHLVNVSSAAGLFGLPFHAAYSGAKFGLRGISEVLRFDLERHRIKVSLVCPGAVNTPLVDTVQIVGAGLSPEELETMKAAFRKRAVTPEKAAQAILRGVTREEYLVFTSNETRIGHFFQRHLAFIYERTMRRLNERLYRHARPVPGPRRQGRPADSRQAQVGSPAQDGATQGSRTQSGHSLDGLSRG